MKILQVGGLAGPGSVAGGVWKVALAQMATLSKSDQVLLFGGWLGPVSTPANHNVKYVRLYRPFPGAALRGLWSARWPLRIAKAAHRADVVHLHLARDFFTTTALLAGIWTGTPVVAQTHGMLTRSNRLSLRLFDLFARPMYLRGVRTWLSLSTHETSALRDYGVDADRIFEIFNPPPEALERWAAPDRPRFSYISRLAHRKQPREFVAAAADFLSQADGSFLIAGNDQGELAGVTDDIRRAQISAYVELPGELSPQEVQRELARSTALVLPSVGEVFPMIVLEALTVGTPVILTRDSGISEFLGSHGAALLVEPTRSEIAMAMRSLLDKDLAQSLSQSGLRIVSEYWSTESLRLKLLDLYARHPSA